MSNMMKNMKSSMATLSSLDRKEVLLKVSTIIVFIFPVLPLLLMSILASVIMVFSTVSYLATFPEIHVEKVFAWLGLIVWLMGGAAGAAALIRVLLNKRTKATLWLMIYGFISYSIIALSIVFAGIKEVLLHGKPLKLLMVAYIVITLLVMIKQLLLTMEEVPITQEKALDNHEDLS